MTQKPPIPSNQPEQEIIYLEVLPDRDPQPVIKIKRFNNEGFTEYEITTW